MNEHIGMSFVYDAQKISVCRSVVNCNRYSITFDAEIHFITCRPTSVLRNVLNKRWVTIRPDQCRPRPVLLRHFSDRFLSSTTVFAGDRREWRVIVFLRGDHGTVKCLWYCYPVPLPGLQWNTLHLWGEGKRSFKTFWVVGTPETRVIETEPRQDVPRFSEVTFNKRKW